MMSGAITRIALTAGGSIEPAIVLKATLLAGLALIVTHLAGRARAAARHVVLAATFGVLLALPLLSVWMTPVGLEMSSPAAALSAIETPIGTGQAGGFQSLPAAAPASRDDRSAPISAAGLVRVVWAGGTCVFLAPLAAGLLRLRAIRRRALRWPEGQQLAVAAARPANIGRRVDVFLQSEIAAPMTCGFLFPRIVLPLDAREWDARDLHHAIVHELEHIRRADWLIHILARTVCSMYWFHPLVWIVRRRLSLEAERACDDAVLERAERTAYAEQLVQLAERLSRSDARPVLAMAARTDLADRVRAVLDETRRRGRTSRPVALLVSLVAASAVLAISPLRAVAKPVGASAGLRSPEQEHETPAFEAASVKRNTSGERRMQLGGPPGRFTATNVPVRNLIQNAYRIQPFQLIGGPSWIATERFDIIAKSSGAPDPPPFLADGQTPPSRLQLMLRALLADRFKLSVHAETRELPTYALTIGRSDGRLGAALRKSTTDCAALAAARRGGPGGTGPSAGAVPDGKETGRGPGPVPAASDRPACGVRMGPGTIAAGGVSLSQLARELSAWLNQVVIDRTGLTGTFDVDLTWTPDQQRPGELPPGSAPIDPNGPSIFTAVQEQLGLKLEAQKGPVEVIVIDRIDLPTDD